MAGAAKGLGVEEKILLKRMGKSSEVAQTVAFLASDMASYITAQTINVNGGLYF
jgi:3-oxoacyl-[acyl-carrier protein] reductase